MNDAALARHYERQYGPFTHMGPADKAIWTQYLIAGGAQFAPFHYDLRVGNGQEVAPGSGPYTASIAAALTRKRIDVLCFQNGIPMIIEVKQRAGLTAIGQLLGYRNLFVQDNPTLPTPRLILVTDVLQPDLIPSLIEFDITYFEVRPWTN